MTTVYDIPAAHARIRSAFTNTMPTATYRGAGRPESHFVLERLIDHGGGAARHRPAGDPAAQSDPRAQLPYRTAMGLTYDSGDFRGNMRAGRGARRLERRRRRASARRASAASASASALRAMSRRRSARRMSACASTVRDGAVERARRHAIDRTGARDDLRAGAGGPLRRRAAAHPADDRRHRRAAVRRRLAFGPLDAARRRAADGNLRPDRRAGAQSRSRRSRPPTKPT